MSLEGAAIGGALAEKCEFQVLVQVQNMYEMFYPYADKMCLYLSVLAFYQVNTPGRILVICGAFGPQWEWPQL